MKEKDIILHFIKPKNLKILEKNIKIKIKYIRLTFVDDYQLKLKENRTLFS